jgi:branched-chain amino acid transport system substrate-binding protein
VVNRKTVVLLLAAALVALAAGTALAAKEIRIGVSAPITGDIAALGQSTKNAALMAEEEINAKGGLKVGKETYKVKFIVEDDENKPESTATVFQKLINQDQVVAIIGSQSSKCSNAGAPIAEAAGVPQISPWSTNPNVTKGKQFVFRACFIDPFQGKVVALFAKDRLKAKTAAVLYDVASDYNKGIAEVFKAEFAKAGGKVVAFETYTTGDKDFSAQLTKIKATNPDVLFLPNYFNEVPLQAQQAHKLGLRAKLLGSDSWDNETDLLKVSPADLEGAYFSNHYSANVKNPVSDKFVASYQKKFGMKPDAAGALTYDAALIVFEALKKAGQIDRKAVRNALASIEGFKGVTGTITFGGNPDPVKSAVMIRISGGKFVYDSTVNP